MATASRKPIVLAGAVVAALAAVDANDLASGTYFGVAARLAEGAS